MPYCERLICLNLGSINLTVLTLIKSGIAAGGAVAGAYMLAGRVISKIDDKIDATNAKVDASAAEMRTLMAATAAEMRSSVASTNAKLDTLLATLLKVDIHDIYSFVFSRCSSAISCVLMLI